jgi:predicted Zn-dependent peptidase
MTDSEKDPLGPRPSLTDIRPYRAPRPEQTRLCGGLDVWHLARPELPIVTISLCRDVGSANDSQGAEGLNYITTFMLDQALMGRLS